MNLLTRVSLDSGTSEEHKMYLIVKLLRNKGFYKHMAEL